MQALMTNRKCEGREDYLNYNYASRDFATTGARNAKPIRTEFLKE